MMDRPFVNVDEDENEHYHPEAIIGFIVLALMGCFVGFFVALGIWALVTRAVF